MAGVPRKNPKVCWNDNWEMCQMTDGNCARSNEQIKLQQPLANVPEWLVKITSKQKGSCARSKNHNQLQQSPANVPEWLSNISCNNHWQMCQSDWAKNTEWQQSNKTGTMCPPWKTASSYNWDAVWPSRDWMINCRSQKDRKPFPFVSKETTTLVNQQMCWSTYPILNNKGAPLGPHLATIHCKCQSTNVSINLFVTQKEAESYLPPLPTIKQFKSINKCVDQSLLNSLWKRTCCSFIEQQSASDVNQQLCQSTSSRLDRKRTPFSFTQQSASNINQQLCWLNLSPLLVKGNL